MRQSARAARLLGLGLILAACAPLGPTMALNRGVSRFLFRFPPTLLAFLDTVWLLGAPLLVLWLLGLALVLRPTSRGERLRALGAFIALGLGELALKHWITTPLPGGPTKAPSMLEAISEAVNLDPQMAAAWLARLGSALTGHRFAASAIASAFALRGSFPSGHVARLTFLAAFLSTVPKRGLILGAGLLAGLAVVATGGHWVWDVLGGMAFACGTLAAIGRWA